MRLALCGALVAGCAAPPEPAAVPVRPPDRVRPACVELAERLPERVGDGVRRATEPPSATTAAWGDPPVVLRCGVPRPRALRPTSELVVVNGVEWFAEPRPAGYVFTTPDRVTQVEVRVPADYAPEVNPLVDLAAAVAAMPGR